MGIWIDTLIEWALQVVIEAGLIKATQPTDCAQKTGRQLGAR